MDSDEGHHGPLRRAGVRVDGKVFSEAVKKELAGKQ